ncbi:MAG: hypothetical protein HC923_03335 [Myxococcales bacterium]|nr:hypothetical protein [Myxococcales bacterium]
MQAVWLILLAVGAGLWMRARADSDADALGLNRYVIDVAVPALILTANPFAALDPENLLLAGGAWVVFGLSLLVWHTIGRIARLPKASIASLALVTGLGNTAFLGYPVVSAVYGAAAMPTAILVDQAGTFLVFATAAVVYAQWASGDGPAPWPEHARRVLLFPPLVASMFAYAVSMSPMNAWFSSTFEGPLSAIAATVSPVALVAVGVRLRLRPAILRDRWIWASVVLKMVLLPSMVALAWTRWTLDPLAVEVAWVQLSMPAMVTAAILAADRGLDRDRAIGAVALGLPLTFFIVPSIRFWMMP